MAEEWTDTTTTPHTLACRLTCLHCRNMEAPTYCHTNRHSSLHIVDVNRGNQTLQKPWHTTGIMSKWIVFSPIYIPLVSRIVIHPPAAMSPKPHSHIQVHTVVESSDVLEPLRRGIPLTNLFVNFHHLLQEGGVSSWVVTLTDSQSI